MPIFFDQSKDFFFFFFIKKKHSVIWNCWDSWDYFIWCYSFAVVWFAIWFVVVSLSLCFSENLVEVLGEIFKGAVFFCGGGVGVNLLLMGLDLCWQLSSLNLVAKIPYLGFVISHQGKFWVPFRLICGRMVDLVKWTTWFNVIWY